MEDIEGLNELLSYEERFKMIKKQKRANLNKMKRIKRTYIKAKLEKKRINKEVKKLQAEWQERIKNNPEEAKSAFAQEIRNVTIEDIYPPDLEKEFDKIELRNIKKGRTMKTEDLSDDKDLDVRPPTVADLLERDLKEELAEHEKDTLITPEATEPDEDTRAQLEDIGGVGLTDGDIFIGEDGEEREVKPEDE